MNYDEILNKSGSFRKAAKLINTTKAKFTRLWKKELKLCQRRTSCKNKPKLNRTICKKCSEYIKENKNVERIEKYAKYYYEKNKQKLGEYNKKYQKNNLHKFRKYNKNYRQTQNGKIYNREKRARYRASKLQATPKWVKKKDLKKIYKLCPSGYHVDHIIPLVNKNICGLHVPWNLQYLSAVINASKSNKFDITTITYS